MLALPGVHCHQFAKLATAKGKGKALPTTGHEGPEGE